jgi:acetoin utilization deacetylase AcuC-like enzyme
LEVHDPYYAQRVEQSCQAGEHILDSPDTGICPCSFEVALLAVGGVLTAVDAVMAGELTNAFCAVRPPGHHAERDQAMGFCLFNNVAVAAAYLRKKYGLARILIVDWDVHHGNGTQNAFLDDPSVFYFSIHQHPHYPGTGTRMERGKGVGLGATLNIPLPGGCGDEEYLKIFRETFLCAAMSFEPDFVLISAGFDGHQNDPLSGMLLSENGYEEMTEIVKKVAQECGQGRLVSILEGGYNLVSLAGCVERHLEVLKHSA